MAKPFDVWLFGSLQPAGLYRRFKEKKMKVKVVCVALLAMFVLLMLNRSERVTSSNLNEVSVRPENTAQDSSPGGPVAWAPFRQDFVTREGEPFLIAVDADCPSKEPTGNEFELLAPTPSFVHLSPLYLNTRLPRVANILHVNPQPGDAGKYEIKIRATPCYGSAGSILTFKLKVKRVR